MRENFLITNPTRESIQKLVKDTRDLEDVKGLRVMKLRDRETGDPSVMVWPLTGWFDTEFVEEQVKAGGELERVEDQTFEFDAGKRGAEPSEYSEAKLAEIVSWSSAPTAEK